MNGKNTVYTNIFKQVTTPKCDRFAKLEHLLVKLRPKYTDKYVCNPFSLDSCLMYIEEWNQFLPHVTAQMVCYLPSFAQRSQHLIGKVGQKALISIMPLQLMKMSNDFYNIQVVFQILLLPAGIQQLNRL